MTTVGPLPNMTVHEARSACDVNAQLHPHPDSAPSKTVQLSRTRDLARARTAAIRRVLTEITAAEDRLTGDTYGTCQGCKTRIPGERLEILPYVRYCVRCQQRAA